MPSRIVAATLRDLSYVAANLRPDDVEELNCQFEDWTPAGLAAAHMRGQAYVVEVDGNPEAAVGAASMTHKGLWVAWSWGTRRMWRAVPTITEFVSGLLIPDILAQGGHRCEARALASHTGAHRWLKRMGATERCELPGWGKNGEAFKLFDWTREDLERRNDVHLIPADRSAVGLSALDLSAQADAADMARTRAIAAAETVALALP